MSAYGRRLMRQPEKQVFNGAEWINAIQRCRPYTEEVVPGTTQGTTISAAIGALRDVRGALNSLLDHQVPDDDTVTHDVLAHAIGITVIRSIEIAKSEESPTAPITKAATDALRSVSARWERLGKWGVSGTERQALIDAVDAYETILLASSPAQMHKAYERLRASLETEAA